MATNDAVSAPRPPRINRPPREQPGGSEMTAPPPQPQPPQPPPPPAIEGELIAALEAMGTADFAAAEQALRDAEQKAGNHPELKPRIASWQQLLTFASGYAEFQQQALTEVTSGNEYDTPAGKIAIIESTPENFAFRSQGRTIRRTPEAIPSLVIEAIVADWLDDRPANLLYVGAHHFTKQVPDYAAAREAWQQATTDGADASLLMPLFDDPAVPQP